MADENKTRDENYEIQKRVLMSKSEKLRVHRIVHLQGTSVISPCGLNFLSIHPHQIIEYIDNTHGWTDTARRNNYVTVYIIGETAAGKSVLVSELLKKLNYQKEKPCAMKCLEFKPPATYLDLGAHISGQEAKEVCKDVSWSDSLASVDIGKSDEIKKSRSLRRNEVHQYSSASFLVYVVTEGEPNGRRLIIFDNPGFVTDGNSEKDLKETLSSIQSSRKIETAFNFGFILQDCLSRSDDVYVVSVVGILESLSSGWTFRNELFTEALQWNFTTVNPRAGLATMPRAELKRQYLELMEGSGKYIGPQWQRHQVKKVHRIVRLECSWNISLLKRYYIDYHYLYKHPVELHEYINMTHDWTDAINQKNCVVVHFIGSAGTDRSKKFSKLSSFINDYFAISSSLQCLEYIPPSTYLDLGNQALSGKITRLESMDADWMKSLKSVPMDQFQAVFKLRSVIHDKHSFESAAAFNVYIITKRAINHGKFIIFDNPLFVRGGPRKNALMKALHEFRTVREPGPEFSFENVLRSCLAEADDLYSVAMANDEESLHHCSMYHEKFANSLEFRWLNLKKKQDDITSTGQLGVVDRLTVPAPSGSPVTAPPESSISTPPRSPLPTTADMQQPSAEERASPLSPLPSTSATNEEDPEFVITLVNEKVIARHPKLKWDTDFLKKYVTKISSKLFQCTECDNKYDTITYVEDHAWTKHLQGDYQCSKCEESTSISSRCNIERHFRNSAAREKKNKRKMIHTLKNK